jgi:hypothetical protein
MGDSASFRDSFGLNLSSSDTPDRTLGREPMAFACSFLARAVPRKAEVM